MYTQIKLYQYTTINTHKNVCIHNYKTSYKRMFTQVWMTQKILQLLINEI